MKAMRRSLSSGDRPAAKAAARGGPDAAAVETGTVVARDAGGIEPATT
jgi:hypothetical protein